jgi:hypothetical protein
MTFVAVQVMLLPRPSVKRQATRGPTSHGPIDTLCRRSGNWFFNADPSVLRFGAGILIMSGVSSIQFLTAFLSRSAVHPFITREKLQSRLISSPGIITTRDSSKEGSIEASPNK